MKFCKLRIHVSVLLLIVIIGCVSDGGKKYEKIRSIITPFSQEIQSRNIARIQSITTLKGLESILEWSDSLNGEEFIESLAFNFENFNIFSIEERDSLIILSLGESDNIVGATGGYVFLKKEEGKYKIDLFKGGK